MTQHIINRLSTDLHLAEKRATKYKLISFSLAFCLSGYISIDKLTVIPIIAFIVIALIIKLKEELL